MIAWALLALMIAGSLLGATSATAETAHGNATALLLFLLSSRSAQTQPTPTPGAFERLARGDQRIARALFEAQTANVPGRLSLEEITTSRRSPGTWGDVFRTMKARGLVAGTNLAHAVSRFNAVHRDGPGGGP
jgi:hypothetical protein